MPFSFFRFAMIPKAQNSGWKIYLSFLVATLIPSTLLRAADPLSPEVFELKEFVVYESLIDVVDGLTGEPFEEGHPVVDGFSREFNLQLEEHHRGVLSREYKDFLVRIRLGRSLFKEMDVLCAPFGVKPLDYDPDRFLRIEKAIFTRLVENPFFKIDAIVVWDLDQLNKMGAKKPDNQYARDIRWNEEKQEWERRVTTVWNVRYKMGDQWNAPHVEVIKRQGLNLDTQEGYHFVNRGLGPVPPYAFHDVNLTYPIFIESGKPDWQQVQYLRETYLENLKHIYDPFSWSSRRNTRYHANFQTFIPLKRQVEKARFRVGDREWWDHVLARFIYDIATIKVQGASVLYQREMLGKVSVNANILGKRLDLLNWNPDEDRSVPYDPDRQQPVNVDFEDPQGARFIMIDAYRRFPERFVTLLGERIRNLDSKVSAKDVVKEVIEELSGVPGDIYIEKVTPIQEAELERNRIQLPE